MTAKELAALIDGREAGSELSASEEQQAAESGLLALYMPTANLTQLSGAVKGRAYDPKSVWYIMRDGLFRGCGCEHQDGCPLAEIALRDAIQVNAEYDFMAPGPFCVLSSDTPHETFRTCIGNGAETYCIGLVFHAEDLHREERKMQL